MSNPNLIITRCDRDRLLQVVETPATAAQRRSFVNALRRELHKAVVVDSCEIRLTSAVRHLQRKH
jgi:hypothetical protein